MGERRVTGTPAQPPSIGDSRQPGGVVGTSESRPGLHSRRATAEPAASGLGVQGSGARSYRPAPVSYAPPRERESVREAALHEPARKKVRLTSAPGFDELPWLTAEQNKERRVLHARVAEWRERPEFPSQTKNDLKEALSLVSRIEIDLLRAGELLRGMRTKLLTEAEWRELTDLVERARANTPRRLGRAMGRLDHLVDTNTLSSAEGELLKGSLKQAVAAHDFLTSEELPWRGIVNCVELPLSADSGLTAVVESRVVPGAAFGSCFPRGYSWDESAVWIDKALSRHVPCLAHTTLTNAMGQMLFRGLHQGFMGIPGIHGSALQGLSDADLNRLVAEAVIWEWQNEAPEGFRRRVEERCEWIRMGWAYADASARVVRHQASVWMAMESAAAALCSDPNKLQCAMDGETADIRLFDVALLTRDEFRPWTEHYGQHRTWQAGRELRLSLRGPEGELHPVAANCNVRQFALSVEDHGPDFSNYAALNSCVVKLLGRTDSRELGGDVRTRADDLRSRAAELGGELAAAGYERVRTLPPRALEHPHGPQTRNRVAGLQAEMARLEKNARALEQAGRQLKDMWTSLDEWPTGADAYDTAARLALVAYLMGETPVLSCPVGQDYAGRLDAEVKVLATVTDSHGGHVPPPHMDTAIWDPARAVLREP